jgi:uncharacterized protein (TIGR02284 family)
MLNATQLKPETQDKLKDLIRINIDSSEGLRTAAETVESAPIAGLFREIAHARESHMQQLQQVLEFEGEDVPDDGSAKATAHRWWLEARGKLNGGDDHVVLIEAERGEDAIKERYEAILPEIAGNPINDILLAQYASIKHGHDRIRDLRDAQA